MATASEQLGRNSPAGARNDASGQGTADDPVTDSRWAANIDLGRADYEAAYRESAIMKKACRILPEDALSRGIRFSLDAEQERAVRDRMEQLDLTSRMLESSVEARMFGDAYLMLNDSTDPAQAFDFDNYQLGSLRDLPKLGGFEVVPDNERVNRSLTEGDAPYDSPEVYLRVSDMEDIHPSRLIRTTHKAPPSGGWSSSATIAQTSSGRKNRSYCGEGLIHEITSEVMAVAQSTASVQRLMQRASVITLGVPDLDQLADGEESTLMRRMATKARAMSLWRIFAHPKETTTGMLTVNWSGMDAVLQQQLALVALESDVPESRFLGIEPSGLNASGEASTRRYASKVAEFQRQTFDPVLRVLMPLIAVDAGIGDAIQWSWPSYVVKSEEETLDVRTKRLALIEALAAFLQGPRPMPPGLAAALGEDPQADAPAPDSPIDDDMRQSLLETLARWVDDLSSMED